MLSVSYTHLDVYKRQLHILYLIGQGIRCGSCPEFLSMTVLRVGDHCLLSLSLIHISHKI